MMPDRWDPAPGLPLRARRAACHFLRPLVRKAAGYHAGILYVSRPAVPRFTAFAARLLESPVFHPEAEFGVMAWERYGGPSRASFAELPVDHARLAAQSFGDLGHADSYSRLISAGNLEILYRGVGSGAASAYPRQTDRDRTAEAWRKSIARIMPPAGPGTRGAWRTEAAVGTARALFARPRDRVLGGVLADALQEAGAPAAVYGPFRDAPESTTPGDWVFEFLGVTGG